jgi:hypothetical protein
MYANNGKKIQEFIMFQKFIEILTLGAKVSIFKQHQSYYHSNRPKGFTW